MLKIESHSRGVVISGSEGDDVTAISLRKNLSVPVSSLGGLRFLVPPRFAYKLLEHYGAKGVQWEPRILEYAAAQKQQHDAQIRAQIEVDYAIENAEDALKDYGLKDKLDPHQVEAVAAISVPSLQGMALFDEQGIGKTVMALCGFDRLANLGVLDHLLVIAPKSVLGAWRNDATMLFGQKYRIKVVMSTGIRRRRELQQPHDILVISYETAVSELNYLRSLLSASSRRYMLVVDESYYVKNPSAIRTAAVRDLRALCARAVILCGTPAPNKPFDIVEQVNIADGGIAFGEDQHHDDSIDSVDVIARDLDNFIYLRRLKAEVLPEIPAKTLNTVMVELAPEQRKLYDKASEELILAVRSVDDVEFARDLSSFMARRVALLQICSFPLSIDPLYSEVPAKQLVLDQLLDDLVVQDGEKVVIWSYFRASLQALADRYKDYGIARIDGSVTSVEDRVNAIASFQTDPQIRVFIGNAAAAGAGITLTAAHHAVYESLSNQAAHYMQSVDRIHRRGQDLDVTIHVLLARHTIETSEFRRILRKEEMSHQLLNRGQTLRISRNEFLGELELTD